ncbi:hypothetical protein I350_05982 [Cryptococcus amylolentus CBS 6273]|uniref:Mitochondrial fission process protein 1 n=1 Tax=Cryptococcus amylolentus CBS 6273 TaxID=1296118 RepID=A0A1E3JSQ8_9TREE|nr:hypothetical protein I350_05982 [Cryptococcus amylolentus CBS 6273]
MAASTPAQSLEHRAQNAEQVGEQKLQGLVQEDGADSDTAAYLRRVRDIVRAGSRYTAYSNDVGEAFRPVVPPWVVTAAYGVSWAYLIGDVSFTTYKSSQLGPSPLEAANMSEPTRLSMVAVKRTVFQGVASMALPAFTIHTAVRYAGRAFAKSANVTAKRWGPTVVGIGIVPALPYLFDHPVEQATDAVFDKLEESFFRGGPVPEPKREL